MLHYVDRGLAVTPALLDVEVAVPILVMVAANKLKPLLRQRGYLMIHDCLFDHAQLEITCSWPISGPYSPTVRCDSGMVWTPFAGTLGVSGPHDLTTACPSSWARASGRARTTSSRCLRWRSSA